MEPDCLAKSHTLVTSVGLQTRLTINLERSSEPKCIRMLNVQLDHRVVPKWIKIIGGILSDNYKVVCG
jgi:hypothetical protein